MLYSRPYSKAIDLKDTTLYIHFLVEGFFFPRPNLSLLSLLSVWLFNNYLAMCLAHLHNAIQTEFFGRHINWRYITLTFKKSAS